MKREAVAKDYQVLPLHACMSMSSASIPAYGFDVRLTGMPNFFDLGFSLLKLRKMINFVAFSLR